ncbi:MAG TPA: L-fucose/L-arabinose isomerase family protein [bacterium]|nr:L-fucose/L-arabinose isomerase family protein [bacterium]HPP08473.1 L-fucose/L-arabinose isomerase family protein [bacterium]
MEKQVLGLIVGNRSCFPEILCKAGRERMIKVLEKAGVDVIALSENDTRYGKVETWQDAKKCAQLFKTNADKISGIIVTLPNFGDEQAVADTIRLSDLDVPVLIHAYPDEPEKMDPANRRDSFCGKISVCSNLKQYGIKYSLTTNHTVSPEEEDFQYNLEEFLATCRIVKALKNLKIGAIGTRPDPFKTVRYSEKILENNGISVDVMDLSELFAHINKLDNNDPRVKRTLEEFGSYITVKEKKEPVLKMAKLITAVTDWIESKELKGFAFQCWTSIQENFGIFPCGVMSYFSHKMIPAACEVDVTGLLSMYILQLASGKPSAIVDWNNNYGKDPEKAVLFHCSNFPLDVLDKPVMTHHVILEQTVGKEKTFGAVEGKIKPGPVSFLRLSTDDCNGEITGYVCEGTITKDPLKTFGGVGVAKINNLQELLMYICRHGFEHHVAINLSHTAAPIFEALVIYKGWEIYPHI